MLDMIDLYGLAEEGQGHWSDLSDPSLERRLDRLSDWSVPLDPSQDSKAAALLRVGDMVDTRYRLGRWCDGDKPQFLDWGIRTGNGFFGLKLAPVEMRVFLLAPDSLVEIVPEISLSSSPVGIDEHQYRGTPLYW